MSLSKIKVRKLREEREREKITVLEKEIYISLLA